MWQPKGEIDWDEIMCNFGKWIQDCDYTPSGETFDAGRTCVKAIVNYILPTIPKLLKAAVQMNIQMVMAL